MLKVLTPLLLVQFSQKQTGSMVAQPLWDLQHQFLLTASYFQPSLLNVHYEVKGRSSQAPSRGEVGPESAWSNHHDHLPQGVVVCVLP